MIIKPEFITGNRGRTLQMSWREAATYLTSDKEEDGRLSSVMMDRFGRELDADQAIGLMGGEHIKYENAIIAPSKNECALLSEHHGGIEEAKRNFGLRIAERMGAEIVTVHDHGTDWHYHITFKGDASSRLYGENGRIQAAVDREFEFLRGDMRPISDWSMHAKFVEMKAQLKTLQNQQRSLDRDRYAAIRNEPDPNKKNQIRGIFQSQELQLLHTRHAIELDAASFRYLSRGMGGCAAHEVEKERIERRLATSITRIDLRTGRGLLVEDRKSLWKDYRDREKRFEAEIKLLNQERIQAHAQSEVSLREAFAKAEKAGQLASPAYATEIQGIEGRLQYDLARLDLQAQEMDAQRRRASVLALARGPISRAFLEGREGEKLWELASKRHELDRSWIDQEHSIKGTIGTPRHERALTAVADRFQKTVQHIDGRSSDSRSRAVGTSLKKASTRGRTTLTGSAKAILASAQKEIAQQLKQSQTRKPKEAVQAQARAAAGMVRGTGRAAARAAVRTSWEASRTVGAMTWQASYHGGTAALKLASGAITAPLTGGASLKMAVKEAGKDLATGVRETAKEGVDGTKRTAREAAMGAVQTAGAAAMGLKGLGAGLVPKPLEAGAKALKEASVATAKTSFKMLTLDFSGAAKEAALGTARTAKEASGAFLKAAELPAVVKLPIQLVEKLPVVGTLASLVRTAGEITAAAAQVKSFDLDL